MDNVQPIAATSGGGTTPADAAAPAAPSSASPEERIDRKRVAEATQTVVQPASEEILRKLRNDNVRRNPMLPRLKMFSDMPDKGLFVAFIAAGFALIFGVKTYVWTYARAHDYTLEITIGTAILMIVYGVLAYRIPAVRMRSDRLGDNFYYMGFIFTLASMSAALIQLKGGEDVGALIGSFGIALVSTILGIAGRVTFVQMRTEVEDIEERVRQDLLSAANELRGQLGAAVRDLESFRTGAQQAINERLQESVDAFSLATREQLGQIETAVEKTILSSQAAFAGHEDSAARLTAIGDGVSQAVERLAGRLDAIELPPDAIDRKLESVVRGFGGVIGSFEAVAAAERARYQELAGAAAELRRIVTQVNTQLRKLQENSEAVAAIATPVDALADQLAKVTTAFMNTTASAHSLSGAVRATEDAANGLSQAVKAQGDMLADAARSQSASAAVAARDAEQARASIQRDLEASRAAVMDVQSALVDTVRAVQESQQAVGGLSQSIAAHSEMLSDVSRKQGEAANAAMREADEARASIQRDLKASRAAVAEVQQALADAVRAVTASIDAARS